ncbi:MAG: hypothetical protein Q4D37_01355 [Oscillospiraceae bacterium]|nr:hypothetical protein [Oscillospiraceae bacterium]
MLGKLKDQLTDLIADNDEKIRETIENMVKNEESREKIEAFLKKSGLAEKLKAGELEDMIAAATKKLKKES